jgi:hypothetical protein
MRLERPGCGQFGSHKQKRGTSAAKQFAEKLFKPFPQELKPNESQALIVGAKAPTP